MSTLANKTLKFLILTFLKTPAKPLFTVMNIAKCVENYITFFMFSVVNIAKCIENYLILFFVCCGDLFYVLRVGCLAFGFVFAYCKSFSLAMAESVHLDLSKRLHHLNFILLLLELPQVPHHFIIRDFLIIWEVKYIRIRC